MSVVVFNKRTGKYLQRHSGSFNRLVGLLRYKRDYPEIIIEKFGRCPKINKNRDGFMRWQRSVRDFCIDEVCGAEPENARFYVSKSSALRSVGSSTKSSRTLVLPDYLEIHEIKELSIHIRVVEPDGSSNCNGEE